jgi:phosphonopyruvate decarboxylase
VISAAAFCEKARDAGFSMYSGVPCSYLTPLIDHVIASSATDPTIRYIGAADEGSAVAIACGAELGGRRAVVMLQSSGLGNAVNPLTSLAAVFELPLLLVTTLRGEPGGPPDEPQHVTMGGITTRLLDLLGIPWELFPTEDDAIAATFARAVRHMDRARTPYALVMRKGAVRGGTAVAPRLVHQPPRYPLPPTGWDGQRPARGELLAATQAATSADDVIVATTGYTGRELHALGDRANQLYLVGSMGCASSFALGLAWAVRSRRVVVLDGDGAALMHMGAMATLGHEKPRNLVHGLLDNEMHESTGGQATVTSSADLGAVAYACGYPRVLRVTSAGELASALRERTGELTLLHAKVRPGFPAELPRPTAPPRDVAVRLRALLRQAPTGGSA